MKYFIMITERIFRMIQGWHRESATEENVFNAFIKEFIAFNAYFSSRTDKPTDREELLDLISTSSVVVHYESLFRTDEEFRNSVYMLGSLKLPTHRPRQRSRSGQIESHGKCYQVIEGNHPPFSDVLWYIYQIRCNLFHGRKDPTDEVDADIVKYGHQVLSKLMTSIIAAELNP